MRLHSLSFLKFVILALTLLNINVLISQNNIQEEPWISGNNIISTAQKTIEDSNFNAPNSESLNAFSYLKLKVNPDVAYAHAYTTTMVVDVYAMISPTVYETTPVSTTLEISYNPFGNVGNKKNIDLKGFENIRGLRAVITSITSTNDDTGVTINETPDNLELYLGFQSDFYQVLDLTAPTFNTSTLENNELVIEWYPKVGAVYYELEWTWLDNYDKAANGSDIDLTIKQFELNNTRIQTTNLNYRIPLVYDEGFIIYRVRAVGGSLIDKKVNIPGPWSSDDGTNYLTVEQWPGNNTGNGKWKILEEHAHENNKNWQFQASYAEDGKKKEVVSYFDGTLRNRQTVTKINSDDNAIVGEVIYDNQGRPAIEVLPTPADRNHPNQGNNLKFYPDFNLNIDGKIYTHHDFDWSTTTGDNCLVTTEEMSTLIGASAYYSPNSPTDVEKPFQSFVPDAKGYPFSQIQYTPDNTGRIKSKGGVGKQHQINYDLADHEMRYFYTTPTQDELNRLFGTTNVGNVLHYKKNIVIDPNGQVSISYIDPQGRTIATALAGEAPAITEGETQTNLLEPLSDVTANIHGDITTDILEKSNLNDVDTTVDKNRRRSTGNFPGLFDALIATKPVISSKENAGFTFNYSLKNLNDDYNFIASGCSTPYPLVYDLSISLKDECGAEKLITTVNNITELEAQSGTFYQSPDLDAILPVGTYQLSKQLTVNKETLNQYLEDYVTSITTEGEACYVPPIEPVADTTGCFQSCTECLNSLPINVDTYVIIELEAQYNTTTFSLGTGGENTASGTFNGVTVDVSWSGNPTNIAEVAFAISSKIAGYDLLVEACKSLPDENGVFGACDALNYATGGSLTLPSCSVYETNLREDIAPGGQYGNSEFTLIDIGGGISQNQVLDPLSVYNDSNTLLYNDNGVDNDWRHPIGGTYLDALGLPAKVRVIEVENELGVLTYSPEPIVDGNIINEDEEGLWISPQNLANVEDFIDLLGINDSWLDALLPYHPEYCYLEYLQEDCNIGTTNVLDYITNDGSTVTVDSDGYDAYIRSVKTFDDAYNNTGLFDTKNSIYGNSNGSIIKDPYFANHNALLLSVTTTATSNIRRSIMLNALNLRYENNGNNNMLETAYANIMCAGDPTCNGVNGVTPDYINANVDSEAQRNQIWEVYKGFYLGLKARIKATFLNAYAKNQGCYNVCIGNTEGSLSSVTNELAYYFTNGINNFANLGASDANQLCSSDNAPLFSEKEKRFKPANGDLYQDENELITNSGTDYQNYLDSGKCPLLFDLEYFLNGLIKQTDNNGLAYNFPTQTTIYNGTYVTKDLIDNLTNGNISDGLANGSSFTPSISGNELTINQGIYEILTLNLPTYVSTNLGLSWNDYDATATAGSKWVISGFYNFYYDDSEGSENDPANGIFAFQSNLIIRNIGTNEIVDYVIYGTTPIAIGECTIGGNVITANTDDPAAPGVNGDELGGPGELGAVFNSPTCENKDRFEISIRNLFNALNQTSQINAVVDLSTIPTYHNDSFLPDYLGDTSRTATWNNSSGYYAIEKNGIELLKLDTYFVDIHGVGAIDHFVNMELTTADGSNYDHMIIKTISANSDQVVTSSPITVSPSVICPCTVAFDEDLEETNIAFIVDASGSIDHIEEQWIKDGINNFIDDVVESRSNATISLIAMSDSTLPTQNYILEQNSSVSAEVTALRSWINTQYSGSGNRDFWSSGLQIVDSLSEVPDMIIIVSDGSCVEDISTMYKGYAANSKIYAFGQNGGSYFYNGTVNATLDSFDSFMQSLYTPDTAIVSSRPDDFWDTDYAPFNQFSDLFNRLDYLANNLGLCSHPCIPQTVAPVIRKDKYDLWFGANGMNFSVGYDMDDDADQDLVSGLVTDYYFTDNYLEADFYNMNFEYLVDSYLYYTKDVFQINTTAHPQFLTLSQFGDTNLNYGFNEINTVIDDYKLYVDSTSYNGENWQEYVNNIWMLSNNGICPPAPMMPKEEITIDPDTIDNQCETFAINVSATFTEDLYQSYVNTLKEDFKRNYINKAMNNAIENFTMDYSDKEYQYTLYYYDQAGNLVQTVAPEGVNRGNPDNHTFKTQYRYNSLNQLVWQSTPDGGETRFAYDELGRIIASQNALQLENSTSINTLISYTLYDGLGRITEAGQGHLNDQYIINDIGKLDLLIGGNIIDKNDALVALFTKTEQVTKTMYSTQSALAEDEEFIQNNLRNRVSAVVYIDDSTSGLDCNNAIFYDYDIHGNVKKMGYYIFLGADAEKKIKTTEYDYDLISGNVNQVTYQKGENDQFIHRYEYDADNRITLVKTSKDGVLWETDASYEYYAHGPLARTVLGEQKVQGLDYAYTIQGWLKGVNGENAGVNDMGNDNGTLSAKDAFAYSLNYFSGDYAPITATNPFTLAENGSNVNNKNLYNGNIKTMVTSLIDLNENPLAVLQNNYAYDQLNRINSMKSYNGSALAYESGYEYDRNGNLTSLQRFVGGTAMDNLSYNYNYNEDGSLLDKYSPLRNNKLYSVNDDVSLNAFENIDIDNQNNQGSLIASGELNNANYQYDAIGQLTKDVAEGISNINWRVDGKVERIEKTDGTTIIFEYDGLGNRISKTHVPLGNTNDATYTYYLRDAQGNVMAVYHKGLIETTTSIPTDYYLPSGTVHTGVEIIEAPTNIFLTNYTAESGSNITVKAGNSIVINPNSHIKYGAVAHFFIDPNIILPTTSEIVGLKLSEHHIYGSSRLGMQQYVDDAILTDNEFVNSVGDKRYELTNHLGNVLSVISDRKLVKSGIFMPDVLTFNDYYPFGALLPNRHGQSDDYRYGYQGNEKDDEVKGEGKTYTSQFRTYDPRIGRYFTMDPYTTAFASHSPYSHALNNPITLVDKDGDFPKPSKFLADEFGLDLPPLAAGIMDGIIENIGWVSAITTGKLAVDIIRDPEQRKAFYEGIKSLVADPIGTLKSIGKEYMGLVERLANGTATDEDWYQLGYDGSGIIVGGGAKMFLKKLVRHGKSKMSRKAVRRMFDCACFTGETDVLTVSGYKDISEVNIGDKVWIYDADDKKLRLQEVSEKVKKNVKKLYQIQFEDNSLIEVSEDFTFLVDNKETKASELRINDIIILFNGKTIKIKGINILEGDFEVYDLNVVSN
ncbi:RHS repeat-associated core domain-containing protein [Hyunsoonleella pacifica]|uniref:VWA domain-containing protein n=1 Tax=Hyunsoonleella pacifica TaxID=1080224 RepID=A0A4Q9FR69_9FLAO|nr:RHS repeat-associated core domain-containing protein [Hyunsoonleella pacifica]TBN17890.1 VWA domain-containing protein [Hyunsoonleella pacifica]GGD08041.1 hypothetical protein GCM10011368_07510 [Hyunsoonleella pacifica]